MSLDIKIDPIRLPNGLTVYYSQMPSLDFSITACVAACPEYDAQFPAGIRHMLEHILSEDGYGRKKELSIQEREFRLGDANEWSSDHETICYSINVTPRNFVEGIHLICDGIFYPCFHKKELESEREVVLEEIETDKATAYTLSEGMIFEKLFHGHHLSIPILGTPKSVREVTYEMLRRLHQETFTPQNVVLFIAGPSPVEEVRNPLVKYLSKVEKKGITSKIGNKVPQNEKREMVITDRFNMDSVYSARIIITSDYRERIAVRIAGEVFSRHLFNVVRDNDPYAYDCSAAYYSFIGCDVLSIYGTVSAGKYDKLQKVFISEIGKIMRGEINKQDVNETIESMAERFELECATTSGRVAEMEGYWRKPDIFCLCSYLEALRGITPQEVIEAGKKNLRTTDLTTVIVR